MSNFNFTCIEGKLKNDPSMLKDGLCMFTIICESQSKNDIEEFRISTFGKLAETCNHYLKSGSRVLLSGKLSQLDGIIYLNAKEVNFLKSSK